MLHIEDIKWLHGIRFTPVFPIEVAYGWGRNSK
jgi:hypothetical protein